MPYGKFFFSLFLKVLPLRLPVFFSAAPPAAGAPAAAFAMMIS
jgi:hypothetical protein